MLRLTESERAVVEVAAVAEHVASLTAATALFQLRPDVPAESDRDSRPFVPLAPVEDEGGSPGSAAVLTEIRAWARDALGVDHVPAVWRALAHQPSLLEATWRKDRVVFGEGVLDALVKGCAALAVAQFRQSPYWIAYLTQFLRVRCGVDDKGLVEIAGAVMHYVSFNTIAHGMRLDSPMSDLTAADVAPGGRFDHLLPPGARRTAPASVEPSR